MVNRLVLESFKGQHKNPKKNQADHINDNEKDNSLENLQWLTSDENLAKRTLGIQIGIQNSNNKYDEQTIIDIAKVLQEGKSTVPDIAEKFNIPVSTIYDIKTKKRWTTLLKDYNFNNVPHKKSIKQNYSTEDILSVANLLVENELTMKEISEITNVSYDTIYIIKNKKGYLNIIADYDFSNYTAGKIALVNQDLTIIDNLIKNGLTPKEISEKLNIEYTVKFRNAIYERRRKLKKSNK